MQYVYGPCRNINCPNQPPCQRYIKKRKAYDATLISSLEESWTELSCEVCGCFDYDHDLIGRIFNGVYYPASVASTSETNIPSVASTSETNNASIPVVTSALATLPPANGIRWVPIQRI